METLRHVIVRIKSEDGASLVEYALILFMVASMILVVTVFSNSVEDLMEANATNINVSAMNTETQSGTSGEIGLGTSRSCPSGGIYTVVDREVYCSIHAKRLPAEDPGVPFLWKGTNLFLGIHGGVQHNNHIWILGL